MQCNSIISLTHATACYITQANTTYYRTQYNYQLTNQSNHIQTHKVQLTKQILHSKQGTAKHAC